MRGCFSSWFVRSSKWRRALSLELDHVVHDCAEIGEVINIPAMLIDHRVTHPDRESLHATFLGGPLEVQVVLILPVGSGRVGLRAEHSQGIGAQPVDPGNVVTDPEEKRAFTRPVEVLHLNTGVAGITAPWVA